MSTPKEKVAIRDTRYATLEKEMQADVASVEYSELPTQQKKIEVNRLLTCYHANMLSVTYEYDDPKGIRLHTTSLKRYSLRYNLYNAVQQAFDRAATNAQTGYEHTLALFNYHHNMMEVAMECSDEETARDHKEKRYQANEELKVHTRYLREGGK